jgi:hypothetical protein
MERTEAKMQQEIKAILDTQFGNENVEAERDHRDLKVVTDNRRLLIELKASENAQLAIRDALGQLLEYAYFDPGKRKDEHALFIISRGASTAESQNYLDYIPSRFGLDVTYLQYKLGSNHLDLPEPSVSKEKPHAESVS